MNVDKVLEALNMSIETSELITVQTSCKIAKESLFYPAPQSAREVVINYIHEPVDVYSIDKLALAIEAYAESRVKTAEARIKELEGVFEALELGACLCGDANNVKDQVKYIASAALKGKE